MDPWEYNYIKQQVLALIGVDLNSYKAPQMQRRLVVYLNRSGYPNWPKFFKSIQNDPAALTQLKNYLTINVSSFFRDSEKYHYLQITILPELLAQRPSLRIWSAGCSCGQEAYSLAMLLTEATGPNQHHYILATDIDSSALARGKAGGPYLAEDLTNVSPLLRQKYFKSQADGFWVTDTVRHMVTFRMHNLLADTFAGAFDLIICRNVVIYFEPAVKDALYRHFYEALRPGGFLFVGGTEIVSKATEIGFKNMAVSFYQRQPQPLSRLKTETSANHTR
jgi:chemotaxis protein methyltransferase CheR